MFNKTDNSCIFVSTKGKLDKKTDDTNILLDYLKHNLPKKAKHLKLILAENPISNSLLIPNQPFKIRYIKPTTFTLKQNNKQSTNQPTTF